MLHERCVTLSAVCESNPFDRQPPKGPPAAGGPELQLAIHQAQSWLGDQSMKSSKLTLSARYVRMDVVTTTVVLLVIAIITVVMP